VLAGVRTAVGRTLGAAVRATIVLAGVGATVSWTFGTAVRATVVLAGVGTAVCSSFTLSQCKLLHRRVGSARTGRLPNNPAAAWPSTTLVTPRPTRQSAGWLAASVTTLTRTAEPPERRSDPR
jgi:hypothetical protein